MQTEPTTQTATEARYCGHTSRSHWNIALWMFNDEPLYRFTMQAVSDAVRNNWRFHSNNAAALADAALDEAVETLAGVLLGERTPDGYFYTPGTIREAIREDVENAAAEAAQ